MRGVWIIAGVATVLLAFATAGSGAYLRERPAESAGQLLRRYHELYNRKQWAEFYEQAGPDFRRRVSLSEWQMRLKGLHAQLGSMTARVESGYTISFRAPIAFDVELRGVCSFERGKKAERAQFIVRPFRPPILVGIEWHELPLAPE